VVFVQIVARNVARNFPIIDKEFGAEKIENYKRFAAVM